VPDNNADKIKALRNDLQKVFSSEEGKRVLQALANNCFQDKSIFEKDPYIMAYQAGIRDVYLWLINIMNLDIEALEKMTQSSVTN
jgi:hypothetical protein